MLERNGTNLASDSSDRWGEEMANRTGWFMSADQATATTCGRITSADEAQCPWCDQPFESKLIGAHQKRFCTAACKDEFHAALRKWAQRAFDNGRISIIDLRSG